MRSLVWCAALLGAVALSHACVRPPVNTALIVRNLESKCALIAFSGCAAFATDDDYEGEDAGSDSD
jgi:hypothetical protein